MCLFTDSGYLFINLFGKMVLDVAKGDGDLVLDVLTLSGIAGDIGDDDDGDGEDSLDLRGFLNFFCPCKSLPHVEQLKSLLS